MRLINTIEIDPYDFLAKDEQESNSDIIELPEDRNQFWKKCMSARNLGRLEAVRKGSYLVDISTINDDEL
ncbi:hypothetical protein L3C95_28245 [Chitinophaga filiformis]|uniref:hypothetical protein n=1 Tax=Chitinophaga filiformis TaxID=104663 RepID=UPI001F45F9B7|nr:hypothetical protein [Chitinophaga filiformis]MCF6406822.1 hypothetical protein [Chitinophaga filiformis]